MDQPSDQPSDGRFARAGRVCLVLMGFVFLVGIIPALILTDMLLRRSDPTFVVRDVTVYEFNATSPSAGAAGPRLFLNASMRVALSSRNPSRGVSIYYSKSAVYASYRSEQITLPKSLPEFNQGCKAVTDWSPLLEGNMVPVSSDLKGALSHDLMTGGTVPIDVRVEGWLRFDDGSGTHRLLVICPVLLTADLAPTGLVQSMKFHPAQRCIVDVIGDDKTA